MEPDVRKLLDKILNDSKFRGQLQNDPVKALRDNNISYDPAKLPKPPLTLPSDEEIRALLALDRHWGYAKECQSVQHICGWPKP